MQAREERYSRQMYLFGHETQKRIEKTLVVVLAPSESFVAPMIERLVTNIGGQCLCSSNEGLEISDSAEIVDIYYIIVDNHASPRIEAEDRIFYLNTQSISFSKNPMPSIFCESNRDLPHDLYIEYLNILACVVVQEYIKILNGMNVASDWRLNIELG